MSAGQKSRGSLADNRSTSAPHAFRRCVYAHQIHLAITSRHIARLWDEVRGRQDENKTGERDSGRTHPGGTAGLGKLHSDFDGIQWLAA